jgi:Flp pilus assembly protein TadG
VQNQIHSPYLIAEMETSGPISAVGQEDALLDPAARMVPESSLVLRREIMSSSNEINAAPVDTNSREKGAILFIVAACLVLLLGFMGLAIDLGHAYNNKSQLQNMADACALAGGSALNGTPAGIALAETRARDAANNLANRTEFNNKPVTVPASAVKFSADLNAGPWLARAAAEALAVAPTIRFVKVDVPVQPSEVVFAKLIPGIPNTLNFGAEAVAGQVALNEVCRGLDPFSPARRDIGPYGTGTVDPTGNFGYVPGLTYELRLSHMNGQGCGEQGIPGCVTGNFGMADTGGCGGSASCWRNTMVNGSTGNCVAPGSTVPTTTGNLGSNVERALQDRFDQDMNTLTYATLADFNGPYQATSNYRRMLRVPVNDGNIPNGSGDYNINGFLCFFMASRPSISPNSSAICLMYVGSCTDNGTPSPWANKPSITKLVLYR